jgi:Flp pilus assembly protein TadG
MSALRERMWLAAIWIFRGTARRSLRGQSMIEFAIMLPLFLVLVGGVCDFGMYMFQREQAGSCVREVARKASIRSSTAASSSASPQCQKAASKSALALTSGYMTLGAGFPVTASISYPYDPIFLDLIIPMGGWSPIGSLPISSSVTMRMEAGKAT